MRWLFHLVRSDELAFDAEGRYAPASIAAEGFVHASFRDALAESARVHFAGVPGSELRVLALDPRRLDAPVRVAPTPRGPMPHVHGSIPRDAVTVLALEEALAHADVVTGTRFGLVAFAGMTLLDLVGPLDALGRIASMGFDRSATCEVVALTELGRDPEGRFVVWEGSGARVACARRRPPLTEFDVVVIAGGLGTRALVDDREAIAWLASYPANRLVATVCTGSLLLGATGRLRGRRATTHASAFDELARCGAIVERDLRVVDEGQSITAGGVTAGLDLGVHLVERIAGADAAAAIAAQMELPSRGEVR
jgi:cyclohexyl-isocyanide hydratase